MKKKVSYFRFPLFLLRNLFTAKEEALDQIIDFGLYDYSKSFDCENYEVAKQLVWGFYRGGLPSALKKKLNYYISKEVIFLTEECCCFDINGFNPEDELNDILDVFEKDNEFLLQSFEYFKINKSYRKFKIDGDMETCVLDAKKIEKRIPEKEPFMMINTDLLFDFRDKDKTVPEIAQLAMFLSMRSILGLKKYCKTNKELITSRMFGFKSIKDVDSTMTNDNRILFDKFNNRYHFDQIKKSLELNWHILTYSNHNRGLYIAVGKKMTINELAIIAETKKRKNQILTLQANKNGAKKNAQKHVGKIERAASPNKGIKPSTKPPF